MSDTTVSRRLFTVGTIAGATLVAAGCSGQRTPSPPKPEMKLGPRTPGFKVDARAVKDSIWSGGQAPLRTPGRQHPVHVPNGGVAVSSKSVDRPQGLRVPLVIDVDRPDLFFVNSLQLSQNARTGRASVSDIWYALKNKSGQGAYVPLSNEGAPLPEQVRLVVVSGLAGPAQARLFRPDGKPLSESGVLHAQNSEQDLRFVDLVGIGESKQHPAGITVESMISGTVNGAFMDAWLGGDESFLTGINARIDDKAPFAEHVAFAKPVVDGLHHETVHI